MVFYGKTLRFFFYYYIIDLYQNYVLLCNIEYDVNNQYLVIFKR